MYGMELDNSMTKQAYIQLLIDVTRKKLDVMQKLMQITDAQEELMCPENFDEDGLSLTISEKDEQLNHLLELDQGFEKIYNSVKDELMVNKYRYEVEITTLQEYITSITDISIRLHASEQRNKNKLELLLAARRREIKQSKVSSQTAVKYYKTMTNQHEVQSFFYDKKK